MRRRTVFLALGAALLAAAAFGPGVYNQSLPFTRLVAAQGGEWRALTLRSGRTYRAVLHHIARYCYSPGIGVVAQADSASADSLFGLASLFMRELGSHAVRSSDRYITVTLETNHAHPWPWSAGQLYTYAWHRAAADAEWTFLSYAVPTGGDPQAENPASRKLAA